MLHGERVGIEVDSAVEEKNKHTNDVRSPFGLAQSPEDVPQLKDVDAAIAEIHFVEQTSDVDSSNAQPLHGEKVDLRAALETIATPQRCRTAWVGLQRRAYRNVPKVRQRGPEPDEVEMVGNESAVDRGVHTF